MHNAFKFECGIDIDTDGSRKWLNKQQAMITTTLLPLLQLQYNKNNAAAADEFIRNIQRNILLGVKKNQSITLPFIHFFPLIK